MYAIEPQNFACAQVRAWIGEDVTLFIPFWRPTALLVGQNDRPFEHAQAVGSALYCAKVLDGFKNAVVEQFDSWRKRAGKNRNRNSREAAFLESRKISRSRLVKIPTRELPSYKSVASRLTFVLRNHSGRTHMHILNGSAEPTIDATFWNEQERVDPISSPDRSDQTSDRLRRSIEMAVEWAHLGGD